jgi:DNA modification methylase
VTVIIRHGDCREVLRTMPDQSVHCCVTSPPYFGLRDYGCAGQIGLEPTPDAFVDELVAVFSEVKRVLRDDGTLWLNLGDSYGAVGGDTHSGFNARYSGTGLDGGKQAATGKNAQAAGAREVNTGLRPKNLLGVPWRVAFALQADGWYLRQDIIWSKPNPMPESVTDRCTKAHEYIFLLSRSARYYYDAEAIAEAVTQSTIERLSQPNLDNQIGSERVPGKTNGNMKAVGRATGDVYTAKAFGTPQSAPRGPKKDFGEFATRNKRSVWEVTTQPFSEAHFATFPPDLIEPCIKAGCPEGGTVLDPFGGAGTTGLVADRLKRDAILIELNPEYAAMAQRRIEGDAGMFAEVSTVSPADREAK